MAVPWAIGANGAKHSGEVARTFAYASTNKSEGILDVGDMAVQQLAVAGSSVQILPGGCVMLNRSPGGSRQSYVDLEPATVQVAIAATGSGGGRSDLIIRRVEDPDYPSWVIPADPINGPYSKYAVISGVLNTTTTAKQLNLGYPAIALARIDIPVSTSTITTAMIKNMRVVANPRRERAFDIVFPGAAIDVIAATYVNFGNTRPFFVPEWATMMKCRVDFSGMRVTVAAGYGTLRPVFAGNIIGQNTTWDENAPVGWTRASYASGMEIAVPSNLRGTSQLLYFQGNRTGGTGKIGVDTGSTLIGDVEFLEVSE